MKTNKAEQWLLLEQSGELNAWQRWRLAQHMKRHPELAAFRDDLRRLADLSRAAGPADAPGWQVSGAIRQAAAEQQQTRHFAEPAHSWWKPTLATGLAALTVAAFVTFRTPRPAPESAGITHPSPRPTDQIDQEIESLNTLLADAFDAAGEHRNADDLARELLAWEGQEI